jgi:membrane-bound inhibitor of C-type lysozyme
LVWAVTSPSGAQYVTNNYLFHGKGDTQVQLSGTIDADNAEKFAPIFDRFAKSFALSKSK